MAERITERSLYAPLIGHLQELGFRGVQETEISGLFPDITFWWGEEKFILQVKIGEGRKLIEGLADAYEHARLARTANLLVLVYPPEARRPLITDISKVALDSEITCLLLTEYWRQKVEKPARAIFPELKSRIEARTVSPPTIDFVVDSLRDAVEALGETLRSFSQTELKQAIEFVVGRFDLFMALAETKENEETLGAASLDMLSYLLVNQILFYHIYSKVSLEYGLPKDRIVDGLPSELQSLAELIDYFTQITDINYKTIYAVDVANRLPSTRQIVERINQIIKTIYSLKPESVGHDLLGRLFHDLLPQKTRKVLAAFYTKPQAAEILAALSIHSSKETVIDPACGSGTLAVAAYHQKMLLATYGKEKPSIEESNRLHKQFVEHDITCLDIMPFATHLTAVNLSSQTITSTTDFLRVGVSDSLDLITKVIQKRGIEVEPFSTTVQQTLLEHLGPARRWSRGAIDANGRGKTFTIMQNGCVIMNPPFTDRKRLPKDYREKLMDKSQLGKLIEICGSNVNLWGYFVALANYLLYQEGTLAAVIPMNVLRGESTQQVRDFLLDSYRINYVISSLVDIAFSESAVYRDVLFIGEKIKPAQEHSVAFVFLKVSLNGMTIERARSIASRIRQVRQDESTDSEEFAIEWVRQSELQRERRNLMPYVRVAGGYEQKDVIRQFLTEVKARAGDSLTNIAPDDMIRGFEQSPRGLPQICFVARPLADDRLKRAFMILERENEDLHVKIKGTKLRYTIPRRNVIPALRSLTNVNYLKITGIHDFLVRGPYDDWESVVQLTEWRGKFSWNVVEAKLNGRVGYLFVATRFRPTSEHTHLIAFTCDSQFVTTNKFTLIKVQSKNEAVIQCLLLNSVIALASMVQYMSSVTGGFIELKHYDLNLFFRFAFDRLNRRIIERLAKVGEELGKMEFPPLVEQLQARFHGRVKLDQEILKAIGFDQREVDQILPQLYDKIAKELLRLREHRPVAEDEE